MPDAALHTVHSSERTPAETPVPARPASLHLTVPERPTPPVLLPGQVSFEDDLHRLAQLNLSDLQGPVRLLIDQPPGRALKLLGGAPGDVALPDAPLLIVTDSRSPEYLEDLWDARPMLLVAGPRSFADLRRLAEEALRSGPLRWTPGLHTRLTGAERRQLRELARGLSNKEIAQVLRLSERTVHNTLTRIFGKLGAESRLEAALGYWGVDLG